MEIRLAQDTDDAEMRNIYDYRNKSNHFSFCHIFQKYKEKPKKFDIFINNK